jgi:hypothetical protein
LAKDENTVIQFGEDKLAPYTEDVAAMMVDEDLPYDELRQVLDNRLHGDSSFVSVPFDFLAPEIVSEAFDEQEPSLAFDQQVPEIISEAFIEQVSESVAELKPPALESFADSLLDETYSSDESESSVSEPDENSTIDESGSDRSIVDSGDAMVIIIGEVTFSEDEIEVHLGEPSIIVEEIGGIKDMNPTNRNNVAEDDDKSEGTSVSADDSTIDIDVDTDDFDSDASWTSEAPLPELFKQLIFQRLTGEISALTREVYPSDIGRDASAGTGAWF